MIASACDEALMGQALRALEGSGPQDVPVGAVVVSDHGELLGQAGNRRVADNDPTAHAEVLAIRQAAQQLGNWRLDGCTIVVTLEPCPMCAGAIVNARLARLVLGAWNPDYGACGSAWEIPRDHRLAHRVEVVGGVLAEQCGVRVQEFLAARR